MMRSKKVRTVLSRCRIVMVAKGLPVLPAALDEPGLEVLDVGPSDARHRDAGRIGLGHPVGEEAQRQLGRRHGARTGRDFELVQVGGHGGHHDRCPGGDLVPT